MNGELGGRFKGGAAGNALEVAWANDVVEAIERKSPKAIFRKSNTQRHLVIYPNSNASLCEEDEATAILKNKIAESRQRLVEMSNGCFVHVLGEQNLVFDALGHFLSQTRRFV